MQEFNGKGEFVRVFGGRGEGEGQFEGLRGVAVDSEGHVWTVETSFTLGYVPRAEEFTAEGVLIKQSGAEGNNNGQFKSTEGIAVDGKGDVYVADTGNDRIQEFKTSGGIRASVRC